MSLRWRLFLALTLIVVICLGLMAVATTAILQAQRDRLAMNQLNAMATPIAVQARSLLRGQTTLAELQASLKEQADDNNVYIIFGDAKGNIVSEIIPADGTPRLQVSPNEFPHALNQSTQGKFVTAEGDTFIYAAFPLVRTTAVQVLARFDTLVLATPRASPSVIIISVTRPLVLAGLVVLVISLGIAILLARSIYRPINRVRIAAEDVAEGRYDQEIPLAGPKEVRELADAFNRMAGKVKGSQTQLRHWVADVSHQLKSPLTSINGFAQALLDGTAATEEEKQRAAGIINEESQRMKRQVDELLELARMQAGQLRMEHETVNINELLEHCREVFELQAADKHVDIKLYTELLDLCNGDFDRLEQAFSNILDNAIKNSPSGGEIKINGRNQDGDRVEVRVIDEGPGIPPEQLPYLFERFHQTAGTRSGYGLGLAIAKQIIVAHGGTIEARSEPGEGAEFIVSLPTRHSSN
jgi:signal transduction histidine kinase